MKRKGESREGVLVFNLEYHPVPKMMYKVSVLILPLFRLPAKIGGERNV